MAEKTQTLSLRFTGLLFGILRYPRATLQHLIELPRWPWRRMALLVLAAAILPVVATYSVTSQQAAVQFEDALVLQQPAPGSDVVVWVEPPGAGMPPEEMAPAPRLSAMAGLVFPGLGQLGGLALNWLLWSGVLYVIGTMMGGRNTFGQMLHMVIWTWAPFAVRGVLQAGYIWLTQQTIANPGLSGFVASETSFAGVPTLPDASTLVWRTLLGQVDIYLFWHLALIVMGLMVAARLPQRKAVTLALGSWVLLTLLSLLPAVILGSIAGFGMG